MVIKKKEIRTPYNYPDSFTSSWLWDAVTLAYNDKKESNKLIARLNDDDVVMAMAVIRAKEHPSIHDILIDMCSEPKYAGDPRVGIEAARRLHCSDGATSSTKFLLQALLLCEDITMEEICDKLSLQEQTVKYYEKFFFNCRDAEWEPLSAGVRRHIAIGGKLELASDAKPDAYWRYTGATHGKLLLYNEWRWDGENGVPVAAIAKSLQQTTLKNAMRTAEAGEVPKQSVATMIDVIHRMLEDHSSGELDSDQKHILELLSGITPHMKEVGNSDLIKLDAALKVKLAKMQADSVPSDGATDNLIQQLITGDSNAV